MSPDTANVWFSANCAELASLVESILTSAAIIAGAAWAYFHYFKGRTFRERLELAVSATTENETGRNLLQVTTKLRNVGLSKVSLNRKASGLRVFSVRLDELPAEFVEEVAWYRERTVDVLEGHDWIEPGEALQDHHLFVLPVGSAQIIKVEVQVASEKHKWVARCVTAPPEGGEHES